MSPRQTLAAALALTTVLGGCADMDPRAQRTLSGGAIGAGGGAAIGYLAGGSALGGALLGGAAGAAIGAFTGPDQVRVGRR